MTHHVPTMLAELGNFSLYFDGFDHVNHIFSECISSKLINDHTDHPDHPDHPDHCVHLNHQDHMDHLDIMDHLSGTGEVQKSYPENKLQNLQKKIIHSNNLQKNCAKEQFAE